MVTNICIQNINYESIRKIKVWHICKKNFCGDLSLYHLPFNYAAVCSVWIQLDENNDHFLTLIRIGKAIEKPNVRKKN